MREADLPCRVTVCVPVRNGQKYLARCLDSILAQTFGDFELIICDNASADATESICHRYVASDSRIRYMRQDRNIGPAANFNCGVALSKGEYFHWQAHDDLIAPDFLSRCVEVLDSDSSVVLAYPDTIVIDEKGRELETYGFEVALDDPRPSRRFRRLAMVRNRDHRNFEIFGLIRTSTLVKTPLHLPFAHGDRILTVWLSLLGRFRKIRSPLFLARCHESQSMQFLPDHAQHSRVARLLGPGPLPPAEWWNPALKNRIVFSDWNLLRYYARAIQQAPMSPTQRLICHAALAEWTARYWPKLVRDVGFAGETLANRLAARVRRAVARSEPMASGTGS